MDAYTGKAVELMEGDTVVQTLVERHVMTREVITLYHQYANYTLGMAHRELIRMYYCTDGSSPIPVAEIARIMGFTVAKTTMQIERATALLYRAAWKEELAFRMTTRILP